VPLHDMKIISSVTNLSDNKGRKYQVTKTISHKGYNESDLMINDIALIKVLQIPTSLMRLLGCDAMHLYCVVRAAPRVIIQ